MISFLKEQVWLWLYEISNQGLASRRKKCESVISSEKNKVRMWISVRSNQWLVSTSNKSEYDYMKELISE